MIAAPLSILPVSTALLLGPQLGPQLLQPAPQIQDRQPSAAVEASPSPPSAETPWRVSLGGEVRQRFEAVSAPVFGLGGIDDDVAMTRVLAHANVSKGAWRAVLQLGWLDSGGRRARRPATDVDRFDAMQAFVEYRRPIGGTSLMLRAGRQEAMFGSQRLISIRGGPNARRSFDGVRIVAQEGEARLDVFYFRPVRLAPGSFDDATDGGEALAGAYATWPLAGPLQADLYVLDLRREGARFAALRGVERRRTVGLRLFGEARGWDWDVEGAVQDGALGPASIRAWTIASDIGVTLAAPWSPRLSLKANLASGDKNPADGRLKTFNALYPKYPYFSEASLVAPANIVDIHPGLTLKPFRALTLDLGWDKLWKHRRADAFYAPPQTPILAPPTRPARAIGQQWILGATWKASSALALSGQVVAFSPSGRLREAGARSGRYGGVQATWTF